MSTHSLQDIQTGSGQRIAGRAPPSPSHAAFSAVPSQAEIVQALQTSLNPSEIIELFSSAIQSCVPHDGYTYDHPGLSLHCTGGRVSRHKCSYNLIMGDQALGELQFRRGRRFREPELAQLEGLLGALLYPLRNALLYQQAVEAAQTDPLTGLHNRAALERHLPRELAASQRGTRPLAMLVIDLDHFKRINDTLGHTAGDQVLRAVGECLLAATRRSDMIFRTGGEEFVVLLHVNRAEHGMEAAERIRSAFETCPSVLEAAPGFRPTASIGLAIAEPEDTTRSLFDRADAAMYAAKNAGRNQVSAAAPTN